MRILVSVLLAGIGLALVLAFFIAYVSPDPMVVVCVSPLAFPMIFAVAYLFLAPTFAAVYRAQGPSPRTEADRKDLQTELEPLLDRDESIVASTTGTMSEIPAVVSLTTRRLIILYQGHALAFRHAEVEWLRWSSWSAKLAFRDRPTGRKYGLVIGGAHWKLDAEQLAHAASSRFAISRGH